MKHTYVLLFSLCFSSLYLLGCPDDPEPDTSDDTLFFEDWLVGDCGTESEASSLKRLRKLRKSAGPYMLEAAENGPSELLLGRLVKSLEVDYNGSRRRFRSTVGLGMSPFMKRKFSEQTLDDYVSRRLVDLAVSYRMRAISTLAILEYQPARESLKNIQTVEGGKIRRVGRAAVLRLDSLKKPN